MDTARVPLPMLILLLIGLLLVGCAGPGMRRRAAEAEIMEMLRDCLKRKQADPALDCSQYRVDTIRVEPR